MNGKSQSILLQVAFKEAAVIVGSDVAATKLLTSQFYTLLLELHTELNIDADDAPKRGGGGGGWTGAAKAGGGAPRMQRPASAVDFTDATGGLWTDYRAAKAGGEVKPKFPDFKTQDGKDSVYIYDLDGNPTPEAVALIAAATARDSLTAPM